MTGDHDHDWEEDKKLVERFEDSLKSNMDLYFEEEELEDIIRFYFDQQKFLKALRASEYALEKFPFSVEPKWKVESGPRAAAVAFIKLSCCFLPGGRRLK